MQWFKHDADAATDAKIKKLLMRFGTDGYAIYFHCIELIVGNISEQNITFELEHDAEIIADNLKIQGTSDTAPVDRVNQIMRYIVSVGLFEESNGHITCYKILKRLDSSMTSNAKMRALITGAKQSHDKVMIDHDTVMQDETRSDETRSDEKEIRESPENPASPPEKLYPSETYTLADLLSELHTQNIDPGYRHCTPTQNQRWAGDIEKLNRLDGRSFQDIEKAIRWIKTPGQFWAPNIMSGAKLREKFPTVWAQMSQKSTGYNKQLPVQTRTTFLDMED